MQAWKEGFNPTLTVILLGYGLAVLAGATLSINTFLIYHFPYLHEQENYFVVAFWYCIAGVVLSGIGSLSLEKQTFLLSLLDWILIITHCVTNAIVIISYFYVCTKIPGTFAALIMSTSTVYVVLAQYTFLSHIHGGNHNWIELCGAGIVLIGSLSGTIVKTMVKKNIDDS